MPGEADLSLGVERLRDLAAGAGVPLIAANLRDGAGAAPFPAATSVELGGLRVGLVGVLSPALAPAGWRALPAAEAVRRGLAELSPVDVVVALAHEPPEEDAPLAAAVPEIDLLVGAHGGVARAPTRLPSGAIAVRTGNKNRFLGRIDLDEALLARGRAGAWAAGTLQPLDASLPPDAEIEAMVSRYRKAADARELARLTPGGEARPEASGYAGERACERCHAAAARSWRASRHARAFETLARVGSSLDPSCVGCHTTGFGERAGYERPAAVGFLAEVQCEACHGPGKAHLANPAAPYPPPARGEALCLRCHAAERSPDFAYAAYLERIRH